MHDILKPSDSPELVIGLVAPIGVDLELVHEVLDTALHDMGYRTLPLRLTTLMREVPVGKDIAEGQSIQSYQDRIAYANEVRALYGDDALAVLAVSAIRTFRLEERGRRASDEKTPPETAPTIGSTQTRDPAKRFDEDIPLQNHAYIIRQLKRPEEIALLRSIYGKQFIAISAYSPKELRIMRLQEIERRAKGGLINEVDAHESAYRIVDQDSKEITDNHGQNIRDAYPLADVFIDATSRIKCEDSLRRFIYLLFGSNEITPSHDEYGMYMAKSASLRSSDLSRQVGSAIFRPTGEIASLGCNEVPKAGGGTYWTSDPGDRRDFVNGVDPNDIRKKEVLVDLINRLRLGNHLSEPLQNINDSFKISEILLQDHNDSGLSNSKVMDLIEFGRIIHAEMSAISDAARLGIPIRASTLYCTTFPCHICAKHIVASGISRVVYIEPYPKSYANDLHSDSISVDKPDENDRVSFDSFVGVSPYRYRDLYEKGKRKYSGSAQKWNKGVKRPMIDVYFPSYFEAETAVVGRMKNKLDQSIKADSLPIA